jgi:uncharacterized membrane protein YhaH (DUF805 family)
MRPVDLDALAAFFFRANGRIARGEYALGVAFIDALAFALLFFVIARMDAQPPYLLLLLVDLPLVAAFFVVAAKRCHDIGLPGSFVLLLLVPIVGLGWLVALAFIPGSAGPNSYGPEPEFVPQ